MWVCVCARVRVGMRESEHVCVYVYVRFKSVYFKTLQLIS